MKEIFIGHTPYTDDACLHNSVGRRHLAQREV
jgi:hypothetical protein